MAEKMSVLAVLLLTTLVCVSAMPKTGKIDKQITVVSGKQNVTCLSAGLYTGSTIDVRGKIQSTDDLTNVEMKMKLILYHAECADSDESECQICPKGYGSIKPVAVSRISRVLNVQDSAFTFVIPSTTYFNDTLTQCVEALSYDLPTLTPPTVYNTTAGNTTIDNTTHDNMAAVTTHPTEPPLFYTSDNSTPTMRIDRPGGIFILQLVVFLESPSVNSSKTVDITANFKLRNPHGYLSAVDFPALVFYGVMTGVYTLFAIGWLIALALNFSDILRLQFWVLGVILLGFVEKAFFLAEYDSINQGSVYSFANDRSNFHMLMIMAIVVSAVKRSLSRMLLIIVALGYGTVKPRLGDSLGKVLLGGAVYCIVAVIHGVVRARTETAHSNDIGSVLTYAILLLIDGVIMYCIFNSIVETRRVLKIRKNFVKLAMYNHFAYALIFSVVAALAFVIWDLIVYEFPSGMCLKNWSEVWLRDCFWHVLFVIILAIIMFIWRPSTNKSRFSYSLVDNEDCDDTEIEQGSNKNFESVKMRQTSAADHLPPPSLSQAEDDLKWVEENLPTSVLDKALPLLMDSDEEVMTTKYETSKIN